MSLFGSANSAKAHGIEVTLARAGDGGTTLLINGFPYGTARKGKTRDEDSVLVNEALSEVQKAEALVGLMAVLFGEAPEQICKSIADFRQWNQNQKISG
jgi:hypothetical protein